MALIDNYQNLITSQHRDKPKYISTIKKLLQYSEEIFACATYVDDDFDLDIARGVQQNVLGSIVGQSRILGLNDDQYRILQKIKIIKNLWNGEIDDLYTKWMQLLKIPIIIQDNQDMTLDIFIDSNSDSDTTALMQIIGMGLVVPKPMGVGIRYNIRYTKNYTFYVGSCLMDSGSDNLKIADPMPDHKNIIYIGSRLVESGTDIFNMRMDTEFNASIYYGGITILDAMITTIPIRGEQ